MRGRGCKTIVIAGLLSLFAAGASFALSSGSEDYAHDCAECHGVDGRGIGSKNRMLQGYRSTDLTQLRKMNGGEFPREKVYAAIDGRQRIAAHFKGDMPRWGMLYRTDENKRNSKADERVNQRISALVDFIESIQEK